MGFLKQLKPIAVLAAANWRWINGQFTKTSAKFVVFTYAMSDKISIESIFRLSKSALE